MKIFIRMVFPAAGIALGVWLWMTLYPSPEHAVRGQLARLARRISFSADEGTFSRLAGAEGVSGLFSTNVEVNVDIPGHEQHRFAGRDEITQAALLSRKMAESLSVRFPDIDVKVAPEKTTATADVTVEARIGGENDPAFQELKISFQKTEEGWLINRVETVRTISLPVSK